MEQRERDMRSIKAAAGEEFGDVQGVEGIGDGSLRVYVRNTEVCERLPCHFRGVRVDFVVASDISAVSAPPLDGGSR